MLALGIAAFAWGLAEATLFFVVPDVLISFVALRSLRRALAVAVLAALGAVAGGALLYAWATRDPAGVRGALDMLPAIGQEMIERSARRLAEGGIRSVAIDSFRGVPYKTFASAAGAAHAPLVPFLIGTFPARLLRFASIALLIHGLTHLAPAGWPPARRAGLVAGGWLVFYALYWSLMPG